MLSDEGRDHVQVERLAEGAGLLGAIEHGDGPRRRRQRRDQFLGGERPVQAHLEQADPLAGGRQRRDRLLRRADARTHHDDHAIGVEGAFVLDEAVVTAAAPLEGVHGLSDDTGGGVVEGVAGLATLEERVRVLSRAAYHRRIRRQTPGAEGEDVFLRHQRPDVVLGEEFDAVDFVRRTEPVEEVEEGHARAQGRDVRDEREVLRLLHGCRAEHREARRAGVHHVAVVAVDREGVRGQGTRRDMDDRRSELAGDLEHVGDHEQQALGCREGRRHGALLQGPMQSAGRAGLGLHLDDLRHDPPEVGLTGRRPIVRRLAHGRCRRDRVDGHHFTERVGDACGRLVPINADSLPVQLPLPRRYVDTRVLGPADTPPGPGPWVRDASRPMGDAASVVSDRTDIVNGFTFCGKR